jgi:hypothetical protein
MRINEKYFFQMDQLCQGLKDLNTKNNEVWVSTLNGKKIRHFIQWNKEKTGFKSFCYHDQWDVPLQYIYHTVIFTLNELNDLNLALERLVSKIKQDFLLIKECTICSRYCCSNTCSFCFRNISSHSICFP